MRTILRDLNGLFLKFGLELSYEPGIIVALCLLGTTLLYLTWQKLLSRLSARQHVEAKDPAPVPSDGEVNDIHKNKDRNPGEWDPVNFPYPSIEAFKERVADLKPIPYRPFRWGPYHVTMGIRTMPWDEWIELDREFEKYHRIKCHRMDIRGDKAVRVLSDDANPVVKGGAEAAVELVHELAEYLSRRYPEDFEVQRHDCRVVGMGGGGGISSSGGDASSGIGDVRPHTGGGTFCDWGWDGLPPVKSVRITALGIVYELPLSVADGPRAGERAMEIAGLMVQDDLALMIEGADGRYYFQAGSICVPGFWRLEDKIGMGLDDIHLTGHVPQYQERLQTSLERFFRRMPVDKPVTRINYFIQTNRRAGTEGDEIDKDELGWATSSMGDEDEFEHGTHGTAKPKDSGLQTAEVPVDCMRLRTERQTLRRLSRSGAILFTIRTYITPMRELGRERGVPGRMASALRSWPADVAGYKGKERGGWWEPLLEFLDTEHAKET